MSERDPTCDPAREQADLAAAQAAAIGGPVSSEPPPADESDRDEAQRPLIEAGEGESEGFEEAERELVEHTSHGDEHAAFRVIEDAPDEVDDDRATREGGEPDHEYSAEREGDER
ncbi:MAG TPA: hypothetical protein VG186_04975 [Solirubrobacteraceae bacterium]|jgi:hypothetical protein|nr:hypothetical protein [Solirubrobacteraceae bacterium]